MGQKSTELIYMIEMLNYLKRENLEILDIMQILKEENISGPGMSDTQLQTFLSKITNNFLSLSNADSKFKKAENNHILMKDIIENIDRFDGLDPDFDLEYEIEQFDDDFNDTENKRYLN